MSDQDIGALFTLGALFGIVWLIVGHMVADHALKTRFITKLSWWHVVFWPLIPAAYVGVTIMIWILG